MRFMVINYKAYLRKYKMEKKLIIKMIIVVLALFTLFSFIFITGCSSEKKGNEVVSFEGGSLTVEDLEAHHNKLLKDKKFRNNPEMLTKEFILDHAINMEMIIAKGLKEKLHLNPVIRQELHSHMADLFLKVMQNDLISAIDRKSISDEEAKKFYQENPGLYQTKPMYSVSLIKVKEKAEAIEIRNKIIPGKKAKTDKQTFEDAAAEYSIDKKSAANKGATGARSLNKFRPEWREHIKALVLNEISSPKEIKGFWYLFKLTHKSKPVQYKYEDKKQYIINDVLYAKYRDAWESAYKKLRNEFKLKITKSVY